MPFDRATTTALQYQARRMNKVLHHTLPPDRREAEMIQRRVDDILDRRPRATAVASDGEVIWENSSPFVLGQVETIVQNSTGQAEVVLTPEQWRRMGGPEDPPLAGAGCR